MAGWAHALVGDSIEGFKLKRIRSGVETLLAANGVSREIRGHLQSHGLTGVQARHYDGHDYMREKRKALEVLVQEVCRSDAQPKRQQEAEYAKTRGTNDDHPLAPSVRAQSGEPLVAADLATAITEIAFVRKDKLTLLASRG